MRAVIIKSHINQGCPECESALWTLNDEYSLGDSFDVDPSTIRTDSIRSNHEHRINLEVEFVKVGIGEWLPTEILAVDGVTIDILGKAVRNEP